MTCLLAQPTANGGLDQGSVVTSVLVLSSIGAMVIYLSPSRRERTISAD